MMKNRWRSDRGVTLTNIILLIMIIALVVFLAYEIMYVDLFDIAKKENNLTENTSYLIENDLKENMTVKNYPNASQNVEIIIPIVNEIGYQSSESANTNYYYQQLDETGKIIYKALEDNMENMKSGTYKIDFGTKFNSLLKSDGGDRILNVAFQSAWNAFTYDYPGVFYIDVTKLILTTQTTSIGSFSTHRVSLSNDSNANYFAEGISSEVDLRSKEMQIQKIRDKIVKDLQGYSEYEQVKHLHNWMIDNIEYDTTYHGKNNHNVYGALVYKKVVCEGYARTFKYILDGLGIENVLISGTATNSSGTTESHAWNYVKLKEKWYAVDVTWDDPLIKGGGKLTEKLRYQYFLKGQTEFFKNHVEDGYLSKNSMKFTFPILEEKNY